MKIFGNNEMSFETTPPLKPRQIYFTSKSTNEANTIQSPPQLSSIAELPAESLQGDDDNDSINMQLHEEIKQLKSTLDDKLKLIDDVTNENANLKTDRESLTKSIDQLKKQIDDLKSKVDAMAIKLAEANAKCIEYDTVCKQLEEEQANIDVMKQHLSSMNNTIKLKDELISKFQKELYNYAQNDKAQSESIRRLQRENSDLVDGEHKASTNLELQGEIERLRETLTETEQELSEKMIAYEKCLLDIAEQQKTIFHLNDVLTDSKTARSVEELRIEIRSYREKNDELKAEIEKLKQKLRNIRPDSPIPTALDEIGIDEITDRVEKELTYSAQLDSNIMKAIESDEINSDNENYFDNKENDNAMRVRTKQLEMTIEKLQRSLDGEKEKFSLIHKQDANCIETMTKRLEAAIEHENKLIKLLDEERSKTAQLSTKMLEHQFERSKLSTSNLSLNESPISSPRRSLKGSELDQELLKRQNDEIKLLKSQLEREKERALDTEKTLAREKGRFDKELNDQKAYGDGLREEIDRIVRENQALHDELEQTQDR